MEQTQIRVYAWGRGDLGQLGIGDNTNHSEPVLSKNLIDKDIIYIAASDYHTAFVTGGGELYICGSNESGQLGTKDEGVQDLPVHVTALDTHSITHVACGQAHTVAVTDTGALASWGAAEFGQLGQKDISSLDYVPPRILRGTREMCFVRVCCGSAHTLALTGNGEVYSFGQGVFGALGHGDVENCSVPTLIQAIWGLGIVQIACGENHSCALSADGQVYAWGRGKYGQLGHGKRENELLPVAIQALEGQVVTQIACGGDHTMALTAEGVLFSWGSGHWGQIGHGTQEDVCSPKAIISIDEVFQISAGTRHSIALTGRGIVFGWGDNEQGQLGNIGSQKRLEPVPLDFLNIEGEKLLFVLAGGEHTIAVYERMYRSCRLPDGISTINNVDHVQKTDLHTSREKIFRGKSIFLEPADKHGIGLKPMPIPYLPDLFKKMQHSPRNMAAISYALENVFSSPRFLTLTFMVQSTLQQKDESFSKVFGKESAENTIGHGHGLDVDLLRNMYQWILELYNPDVVGKLGTSLVRLYNGIEKHMNRLPQSLWIQALLIGFQSPLTGEKGLGDSVSMHLFSIFGKMTTHAKETIEEWLKLYPKDVFEGRFVRGVQRFITNRKHLLGRRPIPEDIVAAVKVLISLYKANKKVNLVPDSSFYNASISENADLQDEFIKWLQNNDPQAITSFCQVPFLLTPEAKASILQVQANLQKQEMVKHAVVEHLFGNVHESPFLVLSVRRETLVGDSLKQLIDHVYDLKKPLKVIFEGEAGIDEGGVTKEFFQLLVRDLFDVNYGMFTYNEESRRFWLNPNSMESELEFQLVGIILGLAIYNDTILDVHFPPVVYKKLMGIAPEMEDLKDVDPELHKNLQKLLDFKGDVENTFGLHFEVTYDYFGEMRSHQLEAHGSETPVTNLNRKRFVDLYVRFVLEDSISSQFAAFSHGFLELCMGPALTLFQPYELELIICGLPHYDFEALEHVTIYKGGYTKESTIVQWFWKLVDEMSLEDKKKLLFFTTGNDKSPVGGLGSLKFIIQRNGEDTDRLPTAHTCFNILLLPEYSTKAKLEEKLKLAIANSLGFGLQ